MSRSGRPVLAAARGSERRDATQANRSPFTQVGSEVAREDSVRAEGVPFPAGAADGFFALPRHRIAARVAADLAFKAAGFDAVDLRSNLDVAEMRRALKEFFDRSSDANIAVVFYASHGVEALKWMASPISSRSTLFWIAMSTLFRHLAA